MRFHLKHKGDTVTTYDCEVSENTYVETFLIQVAQGLNLQHAKIPLLVPTPTLKKQKGPPYVLKDFKLKTQKNVVHLSVIGRRRETEDLSHIQKVEQRVKELDAQEAFFIAAERAAAAKQSCQEALQEKWQSLEYEIPRARTSRDKAANEDAKRQYKILRNLYELAFRGDSLGIRNVLLSTEFPTNGLPLAFEFACHGNSPESFAMLLRCLEQRLEQYQEQLTAYKMVQTYSPLTHSQSGLIQKETDFHSKCREHGLYVPWKKCLVIALTNYSMASYLLSDSFLTNEEVRQNFLDQGDYKQALYTLVKKGDVQTLRLLLEKVAPICFPERQDKWAGVSVSWENQGILRNLFREDLVLTMKLFQDHKYPDLSYDAFFKHSELIQARALEFFVEHYLETDKQHGNQVLQAVYHHALSSRNQEFLEEVIHPRFSMIREIYLAKQGKDVGIQLLEENASLLLQRDFFSWMEFLCLDVLRDLEFDLNCRSSISGDMGEIHKLSQLKKRDCALDWVKTAWTMTQQESYLDNARHRPESRYQTINSALLFGLLHFSTISHWLTKDHHDSHHAETSEIEILEGSYNLIKVELLEGAYRDFLHRMKIHETMIQQVVQGNPTLESLGNDLLFLIWEYLAENVFPRSKEDKMVLANMYLYRRLEKAYRMLFQKLKLSFEAIQFKANDKQDAELRSASTTTSTLNDVPVLATMDGNDEVW